MLYLEDYLEMIENLPMEMRDKFTEMREMDLQVSNATDSLEEKVNVFFKKCGSGSVKQEWQDEQMSKIRQEYSKALEDADEKVQLANQIYELVDRHLRKLDQEVSKFKMELEADNAGITEILERRTAESEKPNPHLNNNHRHEKHKSFNISSSYDIVPSTKHVTQASNSSIERHSSMSSLAAELGKETALPNTVLNITKVASTSSSVVPPLSNLTYDSSQQKVPTLSTLGGSGSNAAITVAASRAIGATVEMQQGRRTASLKASFEAVKKIPKVLPMGKEVHTHSSNVVSEVKSGVKNKKSTNSSHIQSRTTANGSHHHHHNHHQQQQQQHQRLISSEPVQNPEVPIGTEEGMEVTASGWQADPNEPRYCLCNDVSYGDMVGCDNDDCPLEWFHYGCVGLQQAPRGKWYCPQCLTSMRRRGRK